MYAQYTPLHPPPTRHDKTKQTHRHPLQPPAQVQHHRLGRQRGDPRGAGGDLLGREEEAGPVRGVVRDGLARGYLVMSWLCVVGG